MWSVAGWEDNPEIANIKNLEKSNELLELIAITLWEWGVQSVEYQRLIKPVQACMDALLQVHAIARNLQFKKVIHSCQAAINSMYTTANTDKLKNLANILLQVKRKMAYKKRENRR
jgi:hypothetical protein